jgi:hypothetical protein
MEMAKRKPVPWGQSEAYEQLLEATCAARRAYFETLGTLDDEHWAPIVNPIFRGGPAWPTRPGWQRIRNGEQTILVSDGLSDPIADAEGPNVGFGVEILMATPETIGAYLPGFWLWDGVSLLSNYAAQDGQFDLRYARYGLFLYGMPNPEEERYQGWADEQGYLGFLLGLPLPGLPTTFALPAGNAVMLVAKLLTRAEYEYAANEGPSGAQRLAHLFEQDGSQHLSSLNRSSVI